LRALSRARRRCRHVYLLSCCQFAPIRDAL